MASPFSPPTTPGAAGYPLGLTGATAATRYVGATASGAPGSGTFAVGDFTIDQTGKVYVCTVAGSPGTWAQAGGGSPTGAAGGGLSGTYPNPTVVQTVLPGYELAYAEITADATTTQTVQASATTILTAPSVTFDGSTAVIISFYAEAANNSTTQATVCNLWNDVAGGTDLGRITQTGTTAAAAGLRTLYGQRKLTPAAGATVYTIRAWVTGASTGTMFAVSGTYLPAFIRITRV